MNKLRTVWGTLIAAATALLPSACATPQRVATHPAPVVDIASMSLPERAATIKGGDPISRVEMLLGEPAEVSGRQWVVRRYTPDWEGEAQTRVYRLSDHLWAVVGYIDSSDEVRFIRAWGELYSKEHPDDSSTTRVETEAVAEAERAGAEAVRNGYRDWIVRDNAVDVREGSQPSANE